jgi:glycosyltransferase involved in cell wall biosynthesis
MIQASSRPLRILQVFNRYLQPGGEEKSVARIAEDLEGAGHQVTRFWRDSAEWQDSAAPAKCKQPFLLWSNAAVLAELERVHKQARPDLWLLHNVLPVVSLGVYGLARRLHTPILQWLHNYRPISPSGTLFARGRKLAPEERWIGWKETRSGAWHGPLLTAWLALGYARLKRRGDFEAVRAWVAISEEMKSVFARAGWFPERLHALRHSWHPRPLADAGRDEGYFLFLGRLVEAKGVRFLVDLWRRPALKGCSLVIAGEGELAEELRSLAPPNVRWAGYTEGEAKQELLAKCRAVLLPARWDEPLGLVAYEAFEASRPVLASNLGGTREVVTDGVTGRLLPVEDAAAWEEAILHMDAARASEMGQAGRTWLEANTAPAIWNERFLAIARQTLTPW